jgi:DNA-binding Lrp family transcriptional regulator
MTKDLLSEVLSSPNSVGIAALVSIRPRTQKELAELAGVSVPDVLKHLKRLQQLGLVQVYNLDSREFSVRKVYGARGMLIGDFSRPDISAVRLLRKPETEVPAGDPLRHLESIAEDLILQRRRVREQVRRLGRMIDDLLQDQARLSRVAEAAGGGIDGRVVLETVFAEESLSEAERALRRNYGLKGGRRSIDRVLSESTKNAKK